MKTKWRFFFETEDFIFDKESKFRGAMRKNTVSSCLPESEQEIEFEMSIVPDKEQKHPVADQTGIVYITIPYNYEVGKDIIKGLAYVLSERISLDFGRMKLATGMIMCERLPETPDERALVGDAPFAVEMNMETVVPPQKFDPKQLIDQSSISMDSRLVAQYNSAKENANPVEKFLGFFKIIEALFVPHDNKAPLERALLSDADFYDLFKKVLLYNSPELYKKEYRTFVAGIVRGRHRCAHLKLKKNFGYWSGNPRVRDEIEPYMQTLEAITYHAIRGL